MFNFKLPVIILLSLMPLYVVRFSLFGLPTTLLEVAFLIVFSFWIVECLRKNRLKQAFLNFPLRIPVLVFLLLSLVSVLVSYDFRSGIGLFRAYFIEPVLFYILLCDLSKQRQIRGRDILFGFSLSALYLSVLAIYQIESSFNPFAPHEVVAGRASGVYNSANSLALYLEGIVFFAFAVALRRWRSNFFRNYYLIVGSVGGLALMLSQSMGGLIACVVLLGVASVLYIFRSRWKQIAVWWTDYKIFSLFVVGLLGFTLFFMAISFEIVDRLGSSEYQGTNTLLIRMIVWTGTTQMLWNHPINGAGLGGYKNLYVNYVPVQYTELLQYPHTLFLNFWSELGVGGLCVFLLLTVAVWKSVRRDEFEIKAAVYGYLFLFFIHGLVDVPYFKNDLSFQYWVFASLAFMRF